MSSKIVQFGAAALVAVIGGIFVMGKMGGGAEAKIAAISDSGRMISPGAPWAEAHDGLLLKKVAELAPELEAQGLWSCSTASCHFVGRFMVLRAKADFSDERMQKLLAKLAEPQETSISWPPLPDSQAQAFKFSDGVYFALAQSNRGEAGIVGYAGEAIDKIVAKVIPAPKMAQAPPKPAIKPRPRATGPMNAPMPDRDRDLETPRQ